MTCSCARALSIARYFEAYHDFKIPTNHSYRNRATNDAPHKNSTSRHCQGTAAAGVDNGSSEEWPDAGGAGGCDLSAGTTP